MQITKKPLGYKKESVIFVKENVVAKKKVVKKK